MLIAVIGILLMLLLGGWRALTATGPTRALLAGLAFVYVVWILSEFRITASAKSQDTRTDGATCEAYATARFITMACAFGFESIWSSTGAWLPIGLSLFAAGIGLRAWAIRTLGQAYSHRVRTPDGEAIVDTGPYRVLRHPAYAGMLLAHVGVLVLCFNGWLLAALCGVFVPALVCRIRVEEAHLLQMPAYRAFAAGRARLAPGVW
ncbi:protein-S-isoprenylcysteine methyltransferase [Caldimonas brevitalea]|uniref:Protein-S-isoprenylcysteine methyltransferase n=1 Tax=Caldimonas brevitalea TaxID=413882 RepID=A0A0G3BP33_9BURK|nr:protein-S-isoprenylcysteine methyltransferase [Caldimonas brevitalea]